MRRAVSQLLLALLLGPLAACGGGMGGGGDDAGTVPDDPTDDVPSQTEAALALQVFELVNEERRERGLSPLIWDDAVAQVAYEHSVDMDVRGFFSHINPDGQTPGQRAAEVGIGWQAYGENIAFGQPSPGSVMDAWMDSDGHRANILHTMYSRMGVGVHVAPGGPGWTQNFRD